MRSLGLSLLLVCAGCSTRSGRGANLDVPVYPGAKLTSSGENQSISGANFETTDSREKVIAFYESQLNSKETAGAIKGVKNGRQITVIVTDAGAGKTAGVITELK